jgi:hypothetical protein
LVPVAALEVCPWLALELHVGSLVVHIPDFLLLGSEQGTLSVVLHVQADVASIARGAMRLPTYGASVMLSPVPVTQAFLICVNIGSSAVMSKI